MIFFCNFLITQIEIVVHKSQDLWTKSIRPNFRGCKLGSFDDFISCASEICFIDVICCFFDDNKL